MEKKIEIRNIYQLKKSFEEYFRKTNITPYFEIYKNKNIYKNAIKLKMIDSKKYMSFFKKRNNIYGNSLFNIELSNYQKIDYKILEEKINYRVKRAPKLRNNDWEPSSKKINIMNSRVAMLN